MRMRLSATSFYKMYVALIMFNFGMSETTLFDYSESFFRDLITAMALLVAMFCIFLRKYSVRYLFFSVVTIVPGIINYFTTNQTTLLLTLIAVVLIQDVDLNNILGIIVKVRFPIFVVASVCGLLGICDSAVFHMEKLNRSVVGYAYGYTNPNVCADIVLMFILLDIARRGYSSRMGILYSIFLLLTFFVTYSRSVFLVGALVILLFELSKKYNFVCNILKKISAWVYPAAVFVQVALITLYLRLGGSNAFVNFINSKLMSGRLGLCIMNLYYFRITPFGIKRDVTEISKYNKYYVLDDGYIIILIIYGAVGALVIFCLFQLIMSYLRRNNNINHIIIGIAFAIWMGYEGIVATLEANFMFLFFSEVIGYIRKWKYINAKEGHYVEENNYE